MKRTPLFGLLAGLLLLSPALSSARQQDYATPGAGAATPVSGGEIAATTTCTVGRQADGSFVLPTDQTLTPAGRQIEFIGRPSAIAVRPDGQSAAMLTGFAEEPITVVDLESGDVIDTFSPDTIPDDETYVAASYAGILYSPDGSKLYASDAAGAIIIADVNEDGSLAANSWVRIPGMGGSVSRPGSMAFSADGATLYVVLNMNNTLGVFDLETNTLTTQIPVGNAPNTVVVDGETAYVSNQGGRVAEGGDTTNLSAGTEIVSDPITGGSVTGTVSIVDLASSKVTSTLPVGLQPTGMMLADDQLFVANTNSDTISVIDTETGEVAKTIAVQPFPGAPYGSSPTNFAMTDDDRLVVALGRNNALAIYDWNGLDEVVTFEGLVPTGWNPAQIVSAGPDGDMIVVNEKGVGSLGPETAAGPEATNPTGMYVHSNLGSLSVIALPEPDALAEPTAAVFSNNRWTANACFTNPAVGAATGPALAPVAVPLRIGDPSLIKHVFYIIKENRTYDQVLGDDPRGNGDPSLVQFGQQVTPNQHAMAEQFPLFDNLYCSGSLSADGHQWVTQAFVPQYLEQAFGDFNRSYPYNGGDALAYSPTGFIWDNALRNGKTVRAYGEYANESRGPEEEAGTWADWYNDWLIMTGAASGDPHVARGTFTAHSDVPSLDALLMRDYPAYITQLVPDQMRVELWLEEFNQQLATDSVPNLTMMQLVQDHTTGTTPDFPTPSAMVADNDLAVGRIVDAISHSPIWAESAIFVIEDDAQDGVDHVDGHRTIGFVVSPYAKRGVVDSTYYTQIDMVRTIEQILGLPPMNQMDLAAAPMWGAFTDTADLTPYTAIDNIIPLDEMNPPASAVTGIERAWTIASSEMGFGDLDTQPDSQDENMLNHAIWYGTLGFDIPYPGDDRVLWPHEVIPSRGESEEQEEMEGGEIGE